MPTAEVCRRHGLSGATFYKLKPEYGGLDVSEATRLKALEDEHAKLGRLLADTMLETFVLKDLLGTYAAIGLRPWRTDTEFCMEALEDAFRLHGRPEIFNTDQGSQFTSPRFTQPLLDATVKVSMEGRGRGMDNFMIERLWRSLKYDCVYLHAFETGSAARDGIGKWIDFYNTELPHSALGGRTPVEAHQRPAPHGGSRFNRQA